jgi:DNA polymerase-1
VLFVQLGLPSDRKGKTGYSTDAKVLAKIRDQHEIVPLVERWRELTKLLSTYLLALPPPWDRTAASTRRSSRPRPPRAGCRARTRTSEHPDPHPARPGDPRRFRRRAGLPAAGRRLLPGRAADPGPPVRRARAALGLRARRGCPSGHRGGGAGPRRGVPVEDGARSGKAVNFGIVYGISSFGLSANLGISREEAQTYIDRYRSRIPRVQEFIARTIEETRERGYAVTLFGRRRPVPELRAQNRMTRSLGERLAVNSVIQGSAADIIKVAMVACHRRLRDEGSGPGSS